MFFLAASKWLILSGMIELRSKSISIENYFQIWPPDGASPFVYFFVFPRFGHVPRLFPTIPLEGATR